MTESRQPRTYADACGAAHALDLAGERWALLVMRELLLGPKRFSDLRHDLPGISANVLTQRLEDLEAKGIVVRRKLPPPLSVQVYELTPWGYESEPIFIALGRWATRSPLHDPSLPLSAVSLVLSFRTMFAADRAFGLDARIGLAIGGETCLAHVARGRLAIARGRIETAEATLTGAATAIAAAVYGGVAVADLEASSALTIAGDRALAARFLTLFPLPEKAVAPAT
jgi:DNA-binding HxlR family transcriptional regulator